MAKRFLKAKLGKCRGCGCKTNKDAYWCVSCSIQLHQTRDIPEQTEVSKEWLRRGGF